MTTQCPCTPGGSNGGPREGSEPPLNDPEDSADAPGATPGGDPGGGNPHPGLWKCRRGKMNKMPGKHAHLLRYNPKTGQWETCASVYSSGTDRSGKGRRYDPPWDNPRDRLPPDEPKWRDERGRKRGSRECKEITGPGGRPLTDAEIDAIWKCCTDKKGAIPAPGWFPVLNDCHTTVDNCIKDAGLTPPSGCGRF